MCGIAGIAGSQANNTLLVALLKPIAHRGESNYRYETLVRPNIALGTHRLAIVDEKNGQQPKQNAEGNVFCIFNGEIYNHNQLQAQLAEHFEFTSTSDTEVILAAYLYWKEEFVKHLDGQFGIAIYDANLGTLLLARDHMGIKSLYYGFYKNSIVFSSELKSLAALGNDIIINELPPGTLFKNNKISTYFKLRLFNTSPNNRNDYLHDLRAHLINAVRKRIPKVTHKVACLLSGGLDSSIITYLSKTMVDDTVAYTLIAPGSESPDTQAAIRFCKQFNIRHVIVTPEPGKMEEFYLNEGVEMTESFEPVLVRNAVSYHFVAQKIANDGFKTSLCGEGADELFGGYDFIKEAPPNLRDETIWHSLSIISRTYLQMSDRASMRATLETRVPFMDKDLVDFCLTLPPEARISENTNKSALRDVFKNELPDFICNMRKIGMNEGAGYGANSAPNSIYYKAVKSHYDQNPNKWKEDIEVCLDNTKDFRLNLTDIEEVYNFAKYIRLNYKNLASNRERLQLNSSLISE